MKNGERGREGRGGEGGEGVETKRARRVRVREYLHEALVLLLIHAARGVHQPLHRREPQPRHHHLIL